MLATRIVGIVLIDIGIVIVFLSVAADMIGISAVGHPGEVIFGHKQVAGLIFGIVVLVIGLIALFRKGWPELRIKPLKLGHYKTTRTLSNGPVLSIRKRILFMLVSCLFIAVLFISAAEIINKKLA